ncbi:MAG: Gfo/Idh/MocA family oxidoreductase [Casimicrobiaceae bacterium]
MHSIGAACVGTPRHGWSDVSDRVMGAKIRIGLAGAGWVSAFHLSAWQSLHDVDVVAIADVDRSRAVHRAREFAIAQVRQDVAEMLALDRLDAIDIASPVETHVEQCRLAADQGIAILCQKPLATTLVEARELVHDVAGKARLMVNENWRFRPHYRQVKRWIDDGALGGLQQMRLATRSSGLIADASGTRPALSRQPFLGTLSRLIIGELLIHHLDVTRWLLGALEVRDAVALRGLVKGEHAATILLSSSKGPTAVVEGNMAAAGFPLVPMDTLEIVGTRSSVRLDGDELVLSGARTERQQLDLVGNYQQGFSNAAAHFAECLRHDLPFETEGTDNLLTLALVDAAYAHLSV